MMLAGGRSPEGNRYKDAAQRTEQTSVAKIVAGIACSHVPAIGVAMDRGMTGTPYWEPLFKGYEPAREWLAQARAGCRHHRLQRSCVARFRWRSFPPSSSAWPINFRLPTRVSDRVRCPRCRDIRALAWHLAESLILDEFDMTIANEMPVDHGLTVPLSITCGQPAAWPFPVIPLVRQRRAVSAAHRRALLQARPGHPPRRREIRAGSARRHLRHRRHVAPAAGRARRLDQSRIRHRISRRHDQGPAGADQASRTPNTCARPAPKASRW